MKTFALVTVLLFSFIYLTRADSPSSGSELDVVVESSNKDKSLDEPDQEYAKILFKPTGRRSGSSDNNNNERYNDYKMDSGPESAPQNEGKAYEKQASNDYKQPPKYAEEKNEYEKHEDNSYQNQPKYAQEKNEYGKTNQYKPHTLAQPISAADLPQNLKDLYLPPNAQPFHVKYTSAGPYGQVSQLKVANPRQQLITNVNFAKDFSEIDPYNNQSSWMFRTTRSANYNYTADHATFVVNHHDYTVDMVAIPLQAWLPSSFGPIANAANNEVAISPKQNVLVGPSEKVLMRLWFSCKTVNIGDFPEPASLVLNPWNDPRMGACAFALSDLPNTGIKFRVLATNEGVWASYTREPYARAVQNATFRAFDVFRQIAVRKSYNDWIDAAIQYDRMEGTATWFINGVKVWKIGSLGTLPPNDGYNRLVIDTGAQNPEQIGVPQQVITQIAIFTNFPAVDPNNLNLGVNSNMGLIRIVNSTGFYGPNMRFWDNNSVRENKLYGQGVTMKMKRVVVIKSDSLPVVAGSSNKQGNSYESNQGGYQSAGYNKVEETYTTSKPYAAKEPGAY